MARRNTLPEITGGAGLLRDALGASTGREETKSAAHRHFSAAVQELSRSTRKFESRPDFDAHRPSKVKVPFNLPRDLAEAVRDAVFALSGPPYCLSLAAFAEQALRAELLRLEDVANQGRCFESRCGRLKPGRRVE